MVPQIGNYQSVTLPN